MTTISLKKLQEQIEKNKILISDLQNQIESLEQKRSDKLAQVTRNNADERAQRALQMVERDLEENNERRRELEKQFTEINQKFKEMKNEIDNQVSDHIQDKLSKAREDRDHLRADFIPVVQRLLSDLEDCKKELDSLVLSLSNQLSHISRHQTSGEAELDNFENEL